MFNFSYNAKIDKINETTKFWGNDIPIDSKNRYHSHIKYKNSQKSFALSENNAI